MSSKPAIYKSNNLFTQIVAVFFSIYFISKIILISLITYLLYFARLILIWWLVAIVGLAIHLLTNTYIRMIPGFNPYMLCMLVTQIILAAASILGIIVISKINKRQEQKWHLLAPEQRVAQVETRSTKSNEVAHSKSQNALPRSLYKPNIYTKGVVVLFGIYLIAEIINLGLMSYWFFEYNINANSPKLVSIADNYDYFDGISALLILLPCIIVFLLWIFRANKNLTALKVKDKFFNPWFAIASFFIPFASFVLPVMAMREIWRGSFSEPNDPAWKNHPVPFKTSIWWVFFVFSSIVTSALLRNDNATKDLFGYIFGSFVAEILFAIANILAILIVVAIHKQQQLKWQTIQKQETGNIK